MTTRISLLALLLSLAAVRFVPAANDPVEKGRNVLSGKAVYPWYDKAKDAAKPIRSPQPSPPPKTTTGTRVRGPEGLGVLLQVLGYTALAVLIAVLGVFLARAFVFREVTETQGTRLVQALRHADKVEELPFQIEAHEGDFLGAARKCYEAGDYSRAIIYLFSYQLLQLDHHRVIRLNKGKTNRQYLREARPKPELRSVLELTMVAFEDVFFGKHTLDRARFEACWNQLTQFQQQLPPLESA